MQVYRCNADRFLIQNNATASQTFFGLAVFFAGEEGRQKAEGDAEYLNRK